MSVQHKHDNATRFARRMMLMNDDVEVVSTCNYSVLVKDDGERTCPAGTYRNAETRNLCGENSCVLCSQCLTRNNGSLNGAQEVVLMNTSKFGDVTLWTTFGEDRYWADICYPDSSWRTAGECHCKGLWAGDACDVKVDPLFTFIVSSVMLVVCTALMVVCICFRGGMRSSKWANRFVCMPTMKKASALSLAFEV
jgi:hypothetical protein